MAGKSKLFVLVFLPLCHSLVFTTPGCCEHSQSPQRTMMWSIDSILKPDFLTPPPSPAIQPLPGSTPKRPIRFQPYAKREFHQRLTSVENLGWTPPQTTHDFYFELPATRTPESLPPSPAQLPLRELSSVLDPRPSSKVPATAQCFSTPLNPSQLDHLSQPFISKQTKNNNSWATGVFKTWVTTRNVSTSTQETIPADLLEVRYPMETQDRALAAFILEARRADGNFYPGSTLKNILSALFHVMKQHQGAANVVSFVEQSSREKYMYFPRLHNSLDHILRLLRQNGIGEERKRAEVITPDIETQLWTKGVLGFHSPQSLLNTVFFYNGKNFCLRGVNEHLNLRFSQIQRSTAPDKYTYIEFGSKNRSGGVNDRSDGKIVSIVATDSPRCHVVILNHYFAKLPLNKLTGSSKFYLSPLPYTPTGSMPWFFPDPYSGRKLQMLLKVMCQNAGIEGNFTNHSLRATGTTTLFDAGVPEAVIQKHTGHKSLDALRTYERITPTQEHALSHILTQTSPQTYGSVKNQLTDEQFIDSIPYDAFNM